MIQAQRRAGQEASSARGQAAGHKATADRWKTAFEALADHVRTAVEGSGAEHRDGGPCGCSSCWEMLTARLAKEAQPGDGPATGAGA
ncbi:hypothetical protein ACFWPM_37205, partial [Streptomyces sp. NPDC058479]